MSSKKRYITEFMLFCKNKCESDPLPTICEGLITIECCVCKLRWSFEQPDEPLSSAFLEDVLSGLFSVTNRYVQPSEESE